MSALENKHTMSLEAAEQNPFSVTSGWAFLPDGAPDGGQTARGRPLTADSAEVGYARPRPRRAVTR